MQGGYHGEAGGAIANSSLGRVRLEDVAVRDSYATNAGGGIYSGEPLEFECPEPCAGGAPRLELVDTVVAGNTTGDEGGGVYVQFGTLASPAARSPTTRPRAAAASSTPASSPRPASPAPALTGVTIAGNIATGAGGGVYGDHEGSIALTDVTLAGNTAFDYGGGIAVVSKSSLSMTGGHVRGNISVGEGGGVFTGVEGSVTITDVTFIENEAGGRCRASRCPARSPRARAAAAASSSAAAARSPSRVGLHRQHRATRAAASSSRTTARFDRRRRGPRQHDAANGGGIENAGRRVTSRA